MISCEEAEKLLLTSIDHLPSEMVMIKDSLGRVIYEDIYSPIDSPPFRQSSMDGFTFHSSSLNSSRTLKITGTIPAGDTRQIKVNPGEAMKIFTGAPVPDSCNIIIPVEQCEINEGKVIIHAERTSEEMFIRQTGSQVRKNDLCLKKGVTINPGVAGYLSGLGIGKIKVYKRPSVLVLITGDELIKPGTSPRHGELYDANGMILEMALKTECISNYKILFVKDNEDLMMRAFLTHANDHDLIILTGGVSAGDLDLTPKVLEKCGVKKLFHKVAQKPGKPMYAGLLKEKLVVGFPGNPGAVLTGYYYYLRNVINKLSAKDQVKQKLMPLGEPVRKTASLAFLLKGKTTDNSVDVLPGQDSFMLKAFTEANCLIYLPLGKEKFEKGELVSIRMIY